MVKRMNYINEESVILSEIYSNIVVELNGEDTPIDKALHAIIKATRDFNKIPDPKRILKILVRDYNIMIKDDIVCFIIDSDDESNNEGGEIMKNYKNQFTSGEEKVAKAVIEHFGEGFKIMNPSRITFENCLKTSFPKIGENSHQAVTKMIKEDYLQEKEGKIFLGEKGKEILSL